MDLTFAEKNHLHHVSSENAVLKRGPAIAWNVKNGILPHELLPALVKLAEMGDRMEPVEPWEPPAESGEIFKARLKEFTH